MICRLESIEEYAQSYFSTGHIHASDDLRCLIEVIFSTEKLHFFFSHYLFVNAGAKHVYRTCLTAHTQTCIITCSRMYLSLYHGLQAKKEPEEKLH